MIAARRLLLSAGAGTLLFLSCANFDIWPLAWVGIVPLLFVVLDEECDRPFLWGWVCGLLANGGGFYWIMGLLQRFGHMPVVAALPLYLLLVAYQAITFGLFAWAVRRLRDATPLPVTLIAPVAMTALELVVPFPFPWYLAITQAWVRPVIQIADLTGPLGVTFLLVLSNAAIYDGISAWRKGAKVPWRRIGAAAAAVGAVLVYGQIRIAQVDARRAAAEHVKVGVVQANIGITEKWRPGLREQHLAVHQRLSRDLEQRGADLIVWPESSYPYAFERGQTQDFADRRRVQYGFAKPILFGALTYGGGAPYPYNTALMMDGSGHIVATFDKNFLLVFGEYIPFYEHIQWVRKYVPEASNFARGDGVTTFPLGKWKLGPMICYEDIIPSFGRRLAAERPNLLVNITNDAWFGETSEPWEHLALAVYRAVENRLDLVRAVNTGVSAFVDATGRVYEKGPALDPDQHPDAQPVALLDEVAMLDAGGLYAKVGDLFGMLNLLALLGIATWARKRSGKPVAWRFVGAAAATMAVVLLTGALIAIGPSRIGLAARLWARRPLSEVGNADADAAFGVGLWLVVLSAVAALVSGVWLARRTRGRPRLEAGIAAVALVLVPPLLLGRLEGETAGLVFSAAGAVYLALIGVRIGAPRERERERKS
jgi:apolipoprotein N-acyltransferase